MIKLKPLLMELSTQCSVEENQETLHLDWEYPKNYPIYQRMQTRDSRNKLNT
ncbi:hypothetical protein pb186bvf_015602 [Paramecium bursaria]